MEQIQRWRKGTAIALMVLGLGAILMGVLLQLRTPSPPSEPLAARSADEPTIYREVGVWQGRLAVFLPDTDTPEIVYEVWISTLPPPEQEALQGRIAVADRRELLHLVENYTG